MDSKLKILVDRRIRPFARTCTDGLLDHLLPRHCLMCGAGSERENLCRPCASELPRLDHCCLQCALPLSHPIDRFCGRCLRKPPPWDEALSALAYEFPVDQLVRRFKFGRNLACGQVLAREMIIAIRRAGGPMPRCILPVPLHRWRHFTRAFNQADLLARKIGRGLQIPVCSSFLWRRRRTRAHSGLDAATRKRNIKGAFGCRIPPSMIDNCGQVALIDDVMTTGATLTECTRALRKAGAGRVSVWVAARALDPVQVAG